MVDSCETESAVGDSEDTPDEHAGGDSSKSNSITSEHSLQSVGISATSSQVSGLNFSFMLINYNFQFNAKIIISIKISLTN